MSKTNIKLTNLTIYQGHFKNHILEARYNDGSVKALLMTPDSEKILAMLNILKSTDPNIQIYSFIIDGYESLATQGAPKTCSP